MCKCEKRHVIIITIRSHFPPALPGPSITQGDGGKAELLSSSAGSAVHIFLIKCPAAQDSHSSHIMNYFRHEEFQCKVGHLANVHEIEGKRYCILSVCLALSTVSWTCLSSSLQKDYSFRALKDVLSSIV